MRIAAKILAVFIATTLLSFRFAVALERLEPAGGCYIGMLLGDRDSPSALSTRLGLTPAAFGRFYSFPFDATARQNVSAFLDEVRTSGGIAVLTLEPFAGLAAVTAAQCTDLADLCAQKETQGIGGIMLRFGHEMNGNWYAWGQQPTLYRQTFQLLATSIHARTTRTAMVWSPNNGIGYPFGVGAYSPAAGTASFIEMDTNHDGVLTQADDMFDPFYPGDATVDWVGLTVYHWGVTYPWLENEPPSTNEFAEAMNAPGPGVPANYSRWFYPRYCADAIHHKPLVIAETSSFYNTSQPGANELSMKQAWFRQVYNLAGSSADGPDVGIAFPKMKCVNWFDYYKQESEAQNQFVDWRASASPLVRNAFLTAVRTLRSGQSYFLTAQEFNATQNTNAILPTALPALLPTTGSVSGVVSVKAQVDCDLEVDLLDLNFNFQGGTRIAVNAGTSAVPFSFTNNLPLVDGASYRWSIFLTPTGGSFSNTLTRLTSPNPVARALTSWANIIAAPPSTAPASPITARVQYVSSTDATLNLSLFNMAHDQRGSGALAIKRGGGLVEVNLTPLPGTGPGSYSLQATLTNPSLLAQSNEYPVQLSAAPSANTVTLVVEPPVVVSGEVFRFAVSYVSTSARDLRLEMMDPSGTLISTVVQPISAGSNSVDLTLSKPSAVPGGFTARVLMVPAGGTPAQAIASSLVRSFQVVSDAYSGWALASWGVILPNDAIGPQFDADADGSTNAGEYLALTDPRNPASVFLPIISHNTTAITLSWPTNLARSYQLFFSGNLGSGAWTAATPRQPGTGSTMSYGANLNASGTAGFYRVQVTLP